MRFHAPCATFSAARSITRIPVLVVIYGTLITVMVGAGAALARHRAHGDARRRHLLLLAGSGLLLICGHFFIFLSYRTGATAAVAPFYYMFAPFAVGTGFFFFGTLPNALALCGIAPDPAERRDRRAARPAQRHAALELEPVRLTALRAGRTPPATTSASPLATPAAPVRHRPPRDQHFGQPDVAGHRVAGAEPLRRHQPAVGLEVEQDEGPVAELAPHGASPSSGSPAICSVSSY